MKKFLSGFILAYFIPLVIGVAVLFAVPSFRHMAFRTIVEIPQFGVYFLVRRELFVRNFVGIDQWLNRQLQIVKWIGGARSSLLPGLIANTGFVMDRTSLSGDHQALRPYLSSLVEAFPNVYPARIWLAKSMIPADAEKALPHLEAASRLVPADDRAYRVAIDALLALGRVSDAQVWCKRYRKAQFGGPRPVDNNTLFEGVGLRKMAIEVIDTDGQMVLVGHQGLRLGKSRIYDFSLPKPVEPKIIVFHVGLLPGVEITFEKLSLFGQDGRTDIPAAQLLLTPSSAFVSNDGRMLSTSDTGESIGIRGKRGRFSTFDKLSLTIKFERLGLTIGADCMPRE